MLLHKFISKRFVLGWVLVTAVLALSVQTALPQTESETPRPAERVAIPYLETTEEPLQTDQTVAAADLVPGSKLVFQSYRDSNWEIYSDYDYTTEETRLTTVGAADIHPRFNRGLTRIVFASKRYGNYEIFTMNPDGTGVVQLTNNSSDDGNPYWSPDSSRIVFEAYRDGQAEIYVMNADGSGQTRLTYDGDFDGYPYWSPDGSKIAFTSRRTGGYRIYSMNIDGSWLVQLSQQPYSFNASWSPDGTQIAYDADADGDGWQELWLMNADGSNQHIVVDPGGAIDAWARGWSPDGRYIAHTQVIFINYQGNWYWTNAYLYGYDPVAHSYDYLSNNGLDWHPDWQTADVVAPSSSVNVLPVHSPNPIPVSWLGNDNLAGISGFDIQIKVGANGTWTDWLVNTLNTSATYEGLAGEIYAFRVRARDYGGNVEAWPTTADTFTTIETFPPNTAVSPLPAYTRLEQYQTLEINWGGNDPGNSGIVYYDVQYKIGDGSWVNWHIQTTGTWDYLDVTSGETYYFRSRAVDNAQNVEEWPIGDGDTSTTTYTWGITGLIKDNTGTPIGTAVITTTPTSIFPSLSDKQGTYGAYVASDAISYTVAWAKESYGTLPNTQFLQEEDALVNAILPPDDNVVLNWGFETGSLTPEWSANGTHPATITTSLAHTGQYATFLGQDDANPFEGIYTITSDASEYPIYQTAIDSNNILHVVWRGDESNNRNIFYTQRDISGNWSVPINISNGIAANWHKIVIGPNNMIHVAWKGTTGVYYTQYTGSHWLSPELISNTIISSFGMAIGNDNTAHIILLGYGNGLFYKQRQTNGLWSPIETITTENIFWGQGQILVDDQGNAHVLWAHIVGNTYNQLFYSQRTNSNTWTTEQNISNQSQCHVEGESWDWRIDDNNVIHVVWDCDGFYYMQKSPGGNWSPKESIPANIYRYDMTVKGNGTVHIAGFGTYIRRDLNGRWSSPYSYTSTTSYIDTTEIAVDDNGGVHIVWYEIETNLIGSAVYYVRQYEDENWSPPLEITSGVYPSAYQPFIEVDSENLIHVVFADGVSYDWDIVYRKLKLAESTGHSSITQVVTVPITISTSVLSFMYQLQGLSSPSSLAVTLHNGSTSTELLNLDKNKGQWDHQWVDLSDWAGETVSITFSLSQEADQPIVWAYIDEITLGSTHPDIWVIPTSTNALPSEQTIHTLTYGNQGGAVAENGVITYTLPADISFVSASVPPTSVNGSVLVWEVGSLPAKSEPFTIVVTGTVSPSATPFEYLTSTAVIATPTTELETLNNVAVGQTFIGRFTYLPVVFKN